MNKFNKICNDPLFDSIDVDDLSLASQCDILRYQFKLQLLESEVRKLSIELDHDTQEANNYRDMLMRQTKDARQDLSASFNSFKQNL